MDSKLKKMLLTGFLLSAGAMVTACGNNSGDGTAPGQSGAGSNLGSVNIPDDLDHSDPLAAMHAVLANFPETFDNPEATLEGGILKVAEVSNTPAQGLFGSTVFSATTTESRMAAPSGSGDSIFSSTPERAFGQDGIAGYDVDIDNMALHIFMQEDVYWHDGVPLTLDDLVFAYEVIAHPDYVGIRFTGAIQSIKGIMDYNLGLADSIEGLVLSEDNRELTIFFEDFPPTHLNFGIWSTPLPRHHFAGVSVADMPNSAQVRTDIVSWGPFIVENIVPGESISYVRNDNYVFGAPILDGIVIEIVSDSVAPQAMAQGLFDIMDFSLDQYPYFENPTNFTFVSELVGTYNFIAFRLGDWDNENSINIVDPNRRTADVNLRRAMAYALDQEAITRDIFNGLRFPATSIITPIHSTFLNPELEGFPYAPERAMELLDEAGFIDVTGDGYREDQNGEPLTIIFGIHEAGPNEIIAQQYIQQWAEVGIRVELYQNRLLEFSSYMSALTEDEDWVSEIDLAFGNWVPGDNPNPEGAWGPRTQTNRSRFTNDELERIMADLSSPEAWDHDFMMNSMFELQDWFQEYVPAMFNNWRIGLWAVNNRVTGFSTDINQGRRAEPSNTPWQWHLLGVSSEERYQ